MMAKGKKKSLHGEEPGVVQTVPIRNEKFLPMPSIPCALGMAASYYLYPFFISLPHGRLFFVAAMFVLVASLSFIRVLLFMLNGNAPQNRVSLVKKIGILSAAAALGFFGGIAARRTVHGPPVFGLPFESITAVSGILREDPRTLAGGSGFATMMLREAGGRGALRAGADGDLAVFFPEDSIPRLKEFGRGCEIFTDGKLAQGRGGPVFYAESVHIVKPAPAIEQFRTGLRMTLIGAFRGRQGSSPPVWGNFALALLLGVRDDLDVDLSKGFANSGCSHILALSGMHLAIISAVLAFLLRRPLGLRWASLAGAAFILFYVFIAGSQPSLVRSAIMYLIGTFALWGYLETKPLSLLCMAFIIQMVFQSSTGVSISFILSYLALAGILTIGMSLQSLFRGRLPEIINGGLSASLGAFIATAPLTALYFGSLRPIGIAAGLILAPLSSVFMVLSLSALLVSALPLPIWNILDFFLSFNYRVIEIFVSLAERVPGFEVPNVFTILAGTIVLWAIIIFFHKRDNALRKSIAAFD